MQDDPFEVVGEVDIWVHAGLLTLVLPSLESAKRAGVKRLISFSSTSVFTKVDSSNDAERALIKRIRDEEAAIEVYGEKSSIAWTIFRPTLIYGRGMDKNISFIMKVIQYMGFFPLVGDGSALRQPVHADDLALAVLEVLTQESAFERAYNLSGGETLTYKEMVGRIFASLHKAPRVICINPFIYKYAIIIIKKIMPRYAFVQTSMVDRMAIDMVFDHADATRDFNYAPRNFHP